jgi:protein-tyrosine-phosphatase
MLLSGLAAAVMGGESNAAKPTTVLFMCPHGAAKSVMASAYFQRLAKERGLNVRVDSGGTEPDAAVAPKVAELLVKDGYQVPVAKPRLVTPADLASADVVVSLGCDMGALPAPKGKLQKWDEVPSPSADLDKSAAAIRARVVALVEELSRGAAAQAKPQAAGAARKDEVFVALFNGKDLAGWKPYGQEKWTVENGEILGEQVTKEYGYLGTEKTFKDFELLVKFKCEGNGNSGIFYHSSLEGVNIKGVQVEVEPRPRMKECPGPEPGGTCTGGLYESSGRGWMIKPTQEAEVAMKRSEWNEMRVIVQGARTQTWVNGVSAVDYTDATPKYTDGILALQLHSGGEGRMRFKDIRIREIR